MIFLLALLLIQVPGKTAGRAAGFSRQHLDVAQRDGISNNDFGQGCRGDVQGARSRIKAQGPTVQLKL
jgi:hypothetical protein